MQNETNNKHETYMTPFLQTKTLILAAKTEEEFTKSLTQL